MDDRAKVHKLVNYRNLLALNTVMVNGTFTLVPKAWTFVFCQFTSNPSEVVSLAIVSNTGMRSSSNSGRRETPGGSKEPCTTWVQIPVGRGNFDGERASHCKV